jgi:antitoxin component HigA of HigAB toxin-antitoxin module
MTAPQIHKTANGENLVVLTERDDFALVARAGDEEAENRMTVIINDEARAAVARGEDVALPVAVWEAIEGGMSPIRAVRQWRGLTQVQLSEMIGSPQGYVSTLEKGERKGSAAKLSAIAKALGVPVGLLIE